jgi:hypothetical protein
MALAVIIRRRAGPKVLGLPPTKWRQKVHFLFAGYVCKKKPSRQQRLWTGQADRLPPPVGRVIERLACQATTFERPASVMSITSNLTWFRGEDVTVAFVMVPPYVDVTGWTIQLTLKDTLGGNTQNSFPITATVTDGPRGKFQFTIASGLTKGLAVGRYVWDVRRTDLGKKATLADGYLDLKQEITP